MARGLEFLHNAGMRHCDLKPANVLLDRRLRAKLCDFGFSGKVNPHGENVRGGTKGFRAPEVALLPRDATYNAFAADAFSLGVVLLVAATAQSPTNGDPGILNSILKYSPYNQNSPLIVQILADPALTRVEQETQFYHAREYLLDNWVNENTPCQSWIQNQNELFLKVNIEEKK